MVRLVACRGELDIRTALAKSGSRMKADGAVKHFLLAFLLALVCYALFYHAIEHRRIRKGPWEVTFTNNVAGAPTVLINQPKLAIQNVQISFPDQPPAETNALGTLVFTQPQPVPYPVPFGKCIFLDTTFLPGTVALQLFGHEIQLLPRVLTVDHQEHPWLSDTTITLHSVRSATAQPRAERN